MQKPGSLSCSLTPTPNPNPNANALLCCIQCEEQRQIWDDCVGSSPSVRPSSFFYFVYVIQPVCAVSFCLASIAEDPESKAKFDDRMMEGARSYRSIVRSQLGKAHTGPAVTADQALRQIAFPECDVSADPKTIEPSEVVNDILFGRYPNFYPYDVNVPQQSHLFPRGMATDALYPAKSSLYTDPETGILYNSLCFRPNAETVVDAKVCPSPFVPPTTDELIGKVNCIKPCPVQAYSDGEYNDMWIVSSVPACLGLLFNIYMALTWYMGGKKVFQAVNFNLKMCVLNGLLYGIIDTIPVLILGEELPW
jgi:hypothetical protein